MVVLPIALTKKLGTHDISDSGVVNSPLLVIIVNRMMVCLGKSRALDRTRSVVWSRTIIDRPSDIVNINISYISSL